MGIEYLPLDIETTGIHPLESELVSCVFGDFAEIQIEGINELGVLIDLSEYVRSLNKSTTTIITYRGGTMYSTGFDWPFLRVRYLKHGLVWPFKGFNHIDMYPIIQKWFDLDFSELGTIEDLKANELTKMVIHFGLKSEGNMKGNMAQTKMMVEQEQIDEYLSSIGLMKNKTHNGLKDACIHLLGMGDDGMRGEKVPGMFKEWKESHNDVILDNILTYNKADCEKTMALFEAVRDMVPNRILSGELL